MRAFVLIALMMTGWMACATTPTETTPIVTELPGAHAITTVVPTGHRTDLMDGTRWLATMDWDETSRTATLTLPTMTRLLMIEPESMSVEAAGRIAHAALLAEQPQAFDFEDWCVFCEWSDEYGTIYCYWVPFCCGWPYNNC